MNSISLWRFMPLTKKRENLILIIKIFANFLGIYFTLPCHASYSIHNHFHVLFKDWTFIFSILLNKSDFGSHITYLSVGVCLFLSTSHSVKYHTNLHTTLFSIFFQRVFPRMSVVKVSSPAHECWMKRDRDIGFPTAQGIQFWGLFYFQKDQSALNYLDLNYSDGDQI